MQSLILKTATRLLASLILVFSVYVLLRGHNAPGGGFIGALVAGTGFALYIMAEGAKSVRRAIRIDPRRIIVAGMAIALVSGCSAALAGKPFMSGLWWSVAEVENNSVAIGTPFIFDLGVFVIVLGMILTLILGLEEN